MCRIQTNWRLRVRSWLVVTEASGISLCRVSFRWRGTAYVNYTHMFCTYFRHLHTKTSGCPKTNGQGRMIMTTGFFRRFVSVVLIVMCAHLGSSRCLDGKVCWQKHLLRVKHNFILRLILHLPIPVLLTSSLSSTHLFLSLLLIYLLPACLHFRSFWKFCVVRSIACPNH